MPFTAIPFSLTLSGLLVFFSFGAGSVTFAGGLSCGRGAASSLTAYVFVLQDRNTSMQINAHSSDFNDLSCLKAKYGSAFLLFRLDAKGYVIQDGATLGKVQDLFKPENGLDHQEEALDKQEAELERRQEALEGKLEHLDEGLEQLDEREEASSDAGSRATIAIERRSIEKEKIPLGKELHVLEQQQRALSQQQEVLGRAQEKASREADRGLLRLTTEAIRTGLALRVDRAGLALKR